MMSFVMVFDCTHRRKRLQKLFSSLNLFSQDEMAQVRAIWAACQEN